MQSKHKHTFTYGATGFDDLDIPDQIINFQIDGDVTLTELLNLFHSYVIASGHYPPSGTVLDFVPVIQPGVPPLPDTKNTVKHECSCNRTYV